MLLSAMRLVDAAVGAIWLLSSAPGTRIGRATEAAAGEPSSNQREGRDVLSDEAGAVLLAAGVVPFATTVLAYSSQLLRSVSWASRRVAAARQRVAAAEGCHLWRIEVGL